MTILMMDTHKMLVMNVNIKNVCMKHIDTKNMCMKDMGTKSRPRKTPMKSQRTSQMRSPRWSSEGTRALYPIISLALVPRISQLKVCLEGNCEFWMR